MAKLRKMLGKADDPQIVLLMRMIETQSKQTLAAWAAGYVQAQYLPIYESAMPQDDRLHTLLAKTQAYLCGALSATDYKAAVRAGRQPALDCADQPVAQAAARAISTACGVFQSPTQALGFCFYGAAASAYSKAGLDADASTYVALAAAEFDRIIQSLRAIMVENEPHPVKVDWNC